MADRSKVYDESFYDSIHQGSLRSARTIVPLINKLIEPKSVIDVGCGMGAWLSIFRSEGVEDFIGVDGSHIDDSRLLIPPVKFKQWDLAKPLQLKRKFDLVVSLEVAEHLPEKHARSFIQTLTDLGPIILFSAAVPGQGGTDHVNEQWPDYWADLFAEFGFCAFDCIRDVIWDDDQVDWWYAQNTILYTSESTSSQMPELKMLAGSEVRRPRPLIHPVLQQKIRWSAASEDITAVLTGLPADTNTIILVGANELDIAHDLSLEVLPFTERNGHFWGFPEDDAQAISEVSRLQKSGVHTIVFPWFTLWFLEQHQDFRQYLESNYRIIHESENLVIFSMA